MAAAPAADAAKAPDAATAQLIKNILGKRPDDPKLDDAYDLEKQLGKGSFGVVYLVRASMKGRLDHWRRGGAARARSGAGRSTGAARRGGGSGAARASHPAAAR